MPVGGTDPGGGDRKKFSDQLKEEIELQEELIESIKERIEAEKAAGRSVDDLTRKLKDHEKELRNLKNASRELEDQRRKERDAFKDLVKVYAEGVTAYHKYNLSVQRAIDATARFEGQSKLARQEFEQLRHSLNLTRQAAVEFSDTWATGLRLGITNQQLEKMVGNLQKIHGQVQGLKEAQTILATPMTRTQREGVARGDVGSILAASRTANLEQAQAMANLRRRPENRPEEAQRAVRFEQTQAKVATVIDDLKAGMQAFMAYGIGSDIAAILPPLMDMRESLEDIKKNIGIIAGASLFRGGMDLFKGFFGGGGGGGVGRAAAWLGGGGGGGGGAALAGAGGRLALPGPGAGGFGGGGFRPGLGPVPGGYKVVGFGMPKGIGGWGRAVGPGLGFTAAGYLGGLGADTLASHVEDTDPRAAKMARIGGNVARGAGYGAAIGTMIPIPGATAVVAAGGALAGGAYGAYQEYGGGEKKPEPIDMGEVLNRQLTAIKTVQEDLAKIGPALAVLPETLRSKLAVRAGEVGVGLTGPAGQARVTEAQKAFGLATDKALKTLGTDLNKQLSTLAEPMYNDIMALRAGVKVGTAKQADLDKIEEQYKSTIDQIEATAQEEIGKMDLGKGAALARQRMETQRGYVGVEREAVTAGFQMTGGLAGGQEAVRKYREDINKGYEEEARLIKEGGQGVENSLMADKALLQKQIEVNSTNEPYVKQLRVALDLKQGEIEQNRRNTKTQEEVNRLNKLNAELNAAKLQASEYELTLAHKQATVAQTLATTRQEMLRAQGGTPEAFGQAAREVTAGKQSEFATFMKDFEARAGDWRKAAQDIRGEALGVGPHQFKDETERRALAEQYEKNILNDVEKRNQFEKQIFDLHRQDQMAEVEERQKQLGIQKNILELDRSRLTMMGASWQEIMKNTVQIVAVRQQEYKAALAAYEISVQRGDKGSTLEEKRMKVTEAQNALIEATIGKQRDFLEKAIAAGFGMGGGTKFRPNINRAAVFGEQRLGAGGMKIQGAGVPVFQQEALRGAGMIPGAVGGQQPGIQLGPQAGLGPAPVLPGLRGPRVPLGAGAPEVAQGGQAKPGRAEAVDVSGKIAIAATIGVENGQFVGKIEDITSRIVWKMGLPGARNA
jgi:hypothetical protein